LKNKKTPGQAIVIITIFVAVLILLSIVLINIGKIVDIKTSTSQIADGGALSLASQWSQYCNTLKDTMLRKSHVWHDILGFDPNLCQCSDTHCACINWGLIIPLAVVFLAIVMMPLFMPLSLALLYVAVNPLWNEVDAIMKSGFKSAAAEMTQYEAMRESTILSMLEQGEFDKEKAERYQGDVFRYQYGCRQDNPLPAPCTPLYWYYDLTESPEAPIVKAEQKIPRFAAWYWGERYPKVTEAGLGKEIKALIDSLVKITEFNIWNSDTWMYTQVSLKVPANHITCASGSCPYWADPDQNIVRIIYHVDTAEPSTWDLLYQWLNSILGGSNLRGFLPDRFIVLIQKILDIPLYEHIITFAHKTTITLPFFNIPIGSAYDTKEIMKVSESLRGIMLRTVELLNLPVAHRIPSLNNWLPTWYNRLNPNDPDTIYGMMYEILNGNSEIEGIKVWISDLTKISQDIDAVIPRDDASMGNTEWGLGSPAGPECATVSCCGWDCKIPCCYPADCSFYGQWCSACGGDWPQICDMGDLYYAYPPSIMCPLADRGAFCACACAGQAPYCPTPCKLQGDLLPAPNDGLRQNEVKQAIELLTNLQTALEETMNAIQIFANNAYIIMYATGDRLKKQNEAIYGWQDEKTDQRYILQVGLENYPSRDVFPYIKEHYDWGGLWKIWDIVGQTNGSIGPVRVSRYTNDISVGSWWNLRYRMNPAQAQWNIGDLDQVIFNIQDAGEPTTAAAQLTTYGITSIAEGFYGMRKEDIRINKIR
jgi:hypothetical protein